MYTKNQKVWIKVPAKNAGDNFCWISGQVIKTTDKRVKVSYDTGGYIRETYQAPKNIRPINQDPLEQGAA